ncbi:MAG: nitroreductase family protein [Bacillota bacterium]
MELINIRRSVRSYTDQKVEAEKVELLMKAAMQAPSAHNQQAWEFYIVEDKETLEKLSHYSPYSICVASAPMAIVVAGNKEKMVSPEYWQQDLGAATQNILLEAANIGLGGVWLACAPVEDRMQNIKDMFGLDDNILPYCVISVGYPKWENAHKFKDRFNAESVHYLDRK